MNTEKKNMNIVLAVVICLALVGVLIFISLKNKENMPLNNDVNNIVNDVSDNTTPTIPSEDSVSVGEVAKNGDTVSVNYTGRLENGTVFDSNVDPKFNHVQSFNFTLGSGQVIPGWEKGIVGMKVGEKKILTIPPADAYGATGVGGVIPPNATLIFDVELLAIKK
ncbi:MAG: FKBP-type peptidyl-prolyl cis-trans isomerase [Candidatus Pacebacteria bacterium]|nr:FKBP-type peptidyl-prolyl cis-trans isomerase [Candidatus Paceibacterota bacterium]